jgi:Nucleotidyl transferase AbiEii toxin, Type IV TA system
MAPSPPGCPARRLGGTRRNLATVLAVNRLRRALEAAAEALSTRRFALVGGIAVSARSEPRFTRDLDLAVAVRDDPTAEEVVREMIARKFRVLTVIEQDTQERLATVRLLAPDETEVGVVVDLLFASSGIEPEIVAQADALEVFAGVVAPVARVGHLLAVKVLARDDEHRPQDAIDLRALLRAATDEDIALARESAHLIVRRGFHRGRDVATSLEQAIAQYRVVG